MYNSSLELYIAGGGSGIVVGGEGAASSESSGDWERGGDGESRESIIAMVAMLLVHQLQLKS
jgi:hypothetical protein